MSFEYHFYQPSLGHGLKHDPFNALVAPRPIGWISSQNSSGQVNLAPYSFFNAFNSVPPILGFSSVGYKDTIKNIEETGEFCWNLVTKSLASAMNQTGAWVSADVNEFKLAGLKANSCEIINAPRVANTPVAMECRLTQILQLQSHQGNLLDTWMVFGEVVGVHIGKDFIRDGVYDTGLANPVLRGGGAGGYFEIDTSNEFQLILPK